MRITEELGADDGSNISSATKERIGRISQDFVAEQADRRNTCVACGCPDYVHAFEKQGFHYAQCKRCSSLYVKNPLSEAAFNAYRSRVLDVYQAESRSSDTKARHEKKLFAMEVTLSRLFDRGASVRVAFVQPRCAPFIDHLRELFRSFAFEEFDPAKGGRYDLIVLENVIENVLEPRAFLEHLHGFLTDRGHLHLTTRSGSGIDVLLLWDRCQLIPTEHVNLLSPDGIRQLCQDLFRIESLSTPGLMDIPILLDGESGDLPPLLRHLKRRADKTVLDDLQSFLQKNLLSSYLVLLAERLPTAA